MQPDESQTQFEEMLWRLAARIVVANCTPPPPTGGLAGWSWTWVKAQCTALGVGRPVMLDDLFELVAGAITDAGVLAAIDPAGRVALVAINDAGTRAAVLPLEVGDGR